MEEAVAGSMELTPEEDFKARRLEAIKAKALEIKKHYEQDCETFCTVVKMLVAKEPSLDNLLQAPLDKNLLEIKQQSLDALRHFVKEMDKTITRGGDRPSSAHTSSITHAQTEEDFPQLCSTNPTNIDSEEESKQPGNKQVGNTGAPDPIPDVPGGQCKPVNPRPDEGHSDLMDILPDLPGCPPPPAKKSSRKNHAKRLQLYNYKNDKLSFAYLSKPKNWREIAYARLGKVPDHPPFLQPGSQYWELKANSTVTSTVNTAPRRGLIREPCGITCYNHAEGPWCEIQSKDGARICVLAAPPQTPPPPIVRIPPLMRQGPTERVSPLRRHGPMKQAVPFQSQGFVEQVLPRRRQETLGRIPPLKGKGPPEQNAREGVRSGKRSSIHSAGAPYSASQKGRTKPDSEKLTC